MDKVNIVYVGKKPAAIDNVANSGKVWHGHGDVQEVTPVQAAALLKFPDQWQLEGGEDGAGLVVELPPVEVKSETGEALEIDPATLNAENLDKMTKDELRAYAQHKLGKELKPAMAKAEMLNHIELWSIEAGL